jgi:ABC-type transporter Mla subunit MlaD
VLGEKYLSVTPKSADAPLLADGGALVESRPQTEIDQLVNALGPMVEELDTDAMNVTLRAVSGALAEDPGRLSRMLRDGEEALHNLAEASRELGPLASEARATLAEVRELSREARPVLRRADEAVTRLSDASAGLPETAKKVDLLVDETRVAVGDGRRVLGKLEANTADIDQVLKNLKEIDKVELRRLLREEGILVRVREHTVDPAAHP